MHRLLVLIAIAGCGSKGSAPATVWLDLTPLPLQLKVREGAHAAPLEALKPGVTPTMMVSARECVVVVAPSTAMDVNAFQMSIAAQHPESEFKRVRAPEQGTAQILIDYDYPIGPGRRTVTFKLHATIGDAAWTCEPFAVRPDLSCEQAMCRSLRAKP